MTISDSFAALLVLNMVKLKFMEKILEGSFSFFLSTLLFYIYFIPSLNILNVIIIGILITFVELFSFHKINDNLTIPSIFSNINCLFI